VAQHRCYRVTAQCVTFEMGNPEIYAILIGPASLFFQRVGARVVLRGMNIPTLLAVNRNGTES